MACDGAITLDGRLYCLTSDAAVRAGLTVAYIRTLVRQGRLLARRHQGEWIIDETSLAAFVSNRQPTEQTSPRAARDAPRRVDPCRSARAPRSTSRA
jgi:hypothetical protein